jgi:CheY-like chemotaxis protein
MAASKMNTDSNRPTCLASTGQTAPVVIVDDEACHAMLAEGVFDELRPGFPVHILTSGQDLVAYLEGEDLYRNRSQYPYPSLVLLDLKMPKMDGFEVLRWLKTHPKHSEIPVVVLSGVAGMAEQVTRAYRMGAHSFLPKPVQHRDVKSVLSLLKISV